MTENEKVLCNTDGAILYQNAGVIQGDRKVSVHLTITVQEICKNNLNIFNQLP
jgi:flagellar biosynthesis regulator FlbT